MYSLEVPHLGTSNEYPQHIFLHRNKKNISNFQLQKKKKKNASSRTMTKNAKISNTVFTPVINTTNISPYRVLQRCRVNTSPGHPADINYHNSWARPAILSR